MITRDRSDDTCGERLAERMRWGATSNAELIAAVRKGSFEALREFYARFEPLLARYAARAGVSLESWEDDAHDALSDVVLSLISDEKRARTKPHDDVRDIHAYIQRAFRNRMLTAHRSAARRDERDARATSSDAATSERMVLATCSESAVRASSGENGDAATLSPAIARLATVLGAELSMDERQLLTWVGNAVPMREIASWIGINYSAAKVRLSRTRSRLRARALRHVNACAGAEREELVAFFRRSAGEAGGTRYMQSADIEAALRSRSAEPGGTHGHD